MRLIDRKRIIQAYTTYPTAKKQLIEWYSTMKQSSYRNLVELRQTFPHADPVGRAIVFNIKGNDFRLITSIHFNAQTCYILEVLTHEQYDTDIWKTRWSVFD